MSDRNKRCSTCKTLKPLQDFYNNARSKDGKCSRCKVCTREYGKRYRQDNTDKIKAMKKAYAEKNKDKIAEYKHNWYKQNSDRLRERGRVWYIKNREEELRRYKEYHVKNAEKIRERSRIYYEQNTEKAKAYQRQWKKENPDKVKTYRLTRSSRKKSLPNSLTPEELSDIFNHFGGCALTGDSDDVHMDHVIPLVTNKGGTFKGNIIPLRSNLNISKSGSNLFYWFDMYKERHNLSEFKFKALVEYLAKENGMSVSEYRQYTDSCFKCTEEAEQ
jgi:hypothetical protein